MLLQLLYTDLGFLYVLASIYTTGVELVNICRVVGLDPSWRSTVREISTKMDEFLADIHLFLLMWNSKTSHGHANPSEISTDAF